MLYIDANPEVMDYWSQIRSKLFSKGANWLLFLCSYKTNFILL
jgi:hypothetical protein